jgi:hypothetical protein
MMHIAEPELSSGKLYYWRLQKLRVYPVAFQIFPQKEQTELLLLFN